MSSQLDKSTIKDEANLRLWVYGPLEAAQYLAGILFADITDKIGKPYYGHLDRVAKSIHEDRLKPAGYLHDLLEDIPGWTREDLEEIGFDKYILDAVCAVTKDKTVPYFDGIVNLSKTPQAIPLKKGDLTDNSNILRMPGLLTSENIDDKNKYYLSFHYLDDIENGLITAGTPFIEWMIQKPPQMQDWALLKKHSRHQDVLAMTVFDQRPQPMAVPASPRP